VRLRRRTPARPWRRAAGTPRAQRSAGGDHPPPCRRTHRDGAARTRRPHPRRGHRRPAVGRGRDLARGRLAVSRCRLRGRAGGQHAGALAGLAAQAGGGELPGRVRAQLPVRGAGGAGALVRPGGRGHRRPRLRPGNRHRAGWPAAQPVAGGGAGVDRESAEPQSRRERAGRRGVVCTGRRAPPRAGAAEGVARPAGAAGRIPGEATQGAAPAAGAGRSTGGTGRGDAGRWQPAGGRTAARFRRAPARRRRARQRCSAGGTHRRDAPVPARGPALAEAGVGGVLADDMGLGKTLQLITHLLSLKQGGALTQPALVVVPTSLIPNWQSEIARFAPTLKVLTLHGPQRAEDFDQLGAQDIVLTSYALLPRDVAPLRQQPFALIVLDEAQQVKNPRTQARRALLSLRTARYVCLTGTPLENHLGELWSQIDLAVPGLLGDEGAFRRHYRLPIEKQRDEECQQRLNLRLAPFILRRTKAQVAK